MRKSYLITLLYVGQSQSDAICILFFFIFVFLISATFVSLIDASIKNKEKSIRRLLKSLNVKCSDYINIVNEFRHSYIENREAFFLQHKTQFALNMSSDYLTDFSRYVDKMCSSSKDKLDSFTLASCFMYSLINNPFIINTDEHINDKEFDYAVKQLNVNLALDCALVVASNPVTYYRENSSGDWIKNEHKAIELLIPNGIIKNSTIDESIVDSLHYNKEVSVSDIMLFSNLLHLIYMYNLETNS